MKEIIRPGNGGIKIKYNNGKILLDIDGNFVSIDNPYWE